MINVILNRILVKPEQLKTGHKVEGTDIEIALGYAGLEKQHEASRVEGHVVGIGPTAYKDLCDDVPIALGDHVVFAKYAGVFVTDPETKETLVVLNDSDVLCIVKGGN